MSISASRRTPDKAAGGLLAPLREAPATVPALVALALFVVWATSQAGYPVTHWAPGGLIVLAAFVALNVDAAGARSVQSLFSEGRLVYPAGYVNANAAMWLMAFWPA